MIPGLLGKEQTAHESLNWEFQLDGWFRKMPKGGFKQSARIGNWKGVRNGIDSKTELYNLDTDIAEKNNVASEQPEIIVQIEEIFKNRSNAKGFPEGGVIQDYKPSLRHATSKE